MSLLDFQSCETHWCSQPLVRVRWGDVSFKCEMLCPLQKMKNDRCVGSRFSHTTNSSNKMSEWICVYSNVNSVSCKYLTGFNSRDSIFDRIQCSVNTKMKLFPCVISHHTRTSNTITDKISKLMRTHDSISLEFFSPPIENCKYFTFNVRWKKKKKRSKCGMEKFIFLVCFRMQRNYTTIYSHT